jgi:uncharacterized Fe-S cluster protein YjdI
VVGWRYKPGVAEQRKAETAAARAAHGGMDLLTGEDRGRWRPAQRVDRSSDRGRSRQQGRPNLVLWVWESREQAVAAGDLASSSPATLHYHDLPRTYHDHDRIPGHRSDCPDVTVFYDRGRCLHFAECVLGLPEVFDVKKRPWIQPQNASAEQVAEVMRRCPSAALHYRLQGSREDPEQPTRASVCGTPKG